MEKVRIDEIYIEKMRDDHDIEKFESYEIELKKFLKEDALKNQEQDISVTYLCILKKTKQVIGYITVLSDNTRLTEELKEKFISKNIRYSTLPAIKIGRLCVHDNYIGKGLGTLLMKFSLMIAKKVKTYVGCRFIVLDAKNNDKGILGFYMKLGFSVLKEMKNHTMMYKDLYAIQKLS